MSQRAAARAGKEAAIYTRYSSDLQSAKSTKDQVAVCRAYAEQNGFDVVQVYSDEAVSGTSLNRRNAWRQLMRDAEDEKFSVVIAEHLDRVSRNTGDYHRESEVLESLGIELHTRSGRLGFLEAGITALVAENFSRELGPKVHRGQEGNVRAGKLAGSFTFGYRKVRGYAGEPEIDEEKAAIVRRIFAEAKTGKPARAIAMDLNRDGIPGPRGGRWNGSTISGNRERATGILRNELYIGRIIWNRADASKLPGKRRKKSARLRDKTKWVTGDRPSLRIIDNETFEAVRNAPTIMRTANRQRTKYLLSGLMRCGRCGGNMVANGADASGRVYVRCSGYTEGSGRCDHARRYHLDDIENSSLEALKSELREPVLIQHYIENYAAEAKRLAAGAAPRRRKLVARQRQLEASRQRYVDAIGDGSIPLRHVADKLAAIEADITEVKAGIAEAEPQRIELCQTTRQGYLSKIARLGDDTLSRDPDSSAVLRDLIESVTVRPAPKGHKAALELHGFLRKLSGHGEQNILTFS
ncbi:MAG TPA: recombinase family protein [Bauldia sp.]